MDARRQRVRRKIIFLLFLALPITLNYYSPALMTQGMAEGVLTASFIFWTGLFVTSLVLGRSFCGWACPFNGLQLGWEAVADKPLRRVRYLRWIKYALWTLWVVGVAAAAVAATGWNGVDLFYNTENIVSVDSPQNLIVYFGLIAFTLLPMTLGKRGFCQYFCLFGVWGIVGERIGHAIRVPRLRLTANRETCTSCKTCTRACPMSLPVQEMVDADEMRNTECTLCLSCVDSCPGKTIRYGFGRS